MVDGDTIKISPAVNGIDTVRLIGIDAPESKDQGCAPQPLGRDAASYAAAIWEGSEVELEFDEERVDRYDRLLAYVHDSAGMTMNEEILRTGYAQVWIISPNDKYEDQLREAQQDARSIELGIWYLTPGEQAQLADRDNGIGSGDGACDPRRQREQPQYEEPNIPNPDLPNPDAPDYTPTPSTPPPSGDIDCSTAPAPIVVPPGSDGDGDGDGVACED